MHKLKMKIAQALNLSPTPQQIPDVDSITSSQQDDEDRCQWDIIRSIDNTILKKLLLESLPVGRKKAAARIRGKSGGSYHHVVYLDAMDIRAKKEDFVIKIPGHGTPDRWIPEDEYMLVREAETMRYLFNNTSIPVPEIIAYSGTLDNTVGFPYIIMTRLPGQSAANIWFEQPFDRDIADGAADFPSLEIEKKRLNFLRSLAEEMTKLQDVQFSAIGMPSFEEYQLNGHQRESQILSTFILQHDDLDLQNILTDTEGNITGIIDWDGSLAMPRCVAAAAVPRFLRRDWFPGFFVRNLHMNLALPRYRDIYAAALNDAGNSDAKYTTKSALYQAVFSSIYEGGSIYDLSEKLVNLVMSGKPCKAMDFLIKLGDPRGWESIKPILHDKLNEILEPELPSITWSQVIAKLADRAALEWMTDFSGIDELDVPEMKSG
ncbi:kinase-like domain-containing protein [Paraphoma chrysanthemicola]|uniref:Kinase-like domain-containing protein n=1 Tax=Paraphoma chrysanthemicola TaxID=798071 RepID=A0A8K0R3W2_9PLEO|nr:kinase-like domain-containing protein [Paraphoma chrysanthemicola]